MLQDISILFFTWFLTFFWQLITAPWLILNTKKWFVDGGWAFGRITGWLLVSLIIWFVSHLGLGVNQAAFIWILTLLLAVVAHRKWIQHRQELGSFLVARKSLIIWEEVIFLFGFMVLPLIRGFHPQLFDLEKFMDAGLMVSYAKSPTLPLLDMWLAGEKFNYYTFGHFMGAVASQFWRLSIPMSYNILLGLICGLVLSQTFGLVTILVSATNAKASLKSLVAAGLIGVILVGIGGNGHAAWYLLKNHSFKGYWYPDATRFIDRTIHEYPSYSFIVSDLHAHVWSLPIVLLTIASIGFWLTQLHELSEKRRSAWWQSALLVGTLLGVLVMTSTWDTAIYSMFLAVLGVLILIQQRKLFTVLFMSAVLMVASMLLSSSMWWLNFVSISEGVRVATEHSPIWQLAVLWGLHVASSLLALVVVFWGKLREKHTSLWWLLIAALVITALLLLLLPELIYMKDIYPNHPRANTMFKLTFQAFTIMGIVMAWLAGWVQSSHWLPKVFSWTTRIWLYLVLIAVLLYPFFGYRDYYDGLRTYHGLNGLTWLQEQNPDDFAAVEWLNSTIKGRPNIVEAVGESYTTFARVSTFTGMPTILGWRVHEWLWRGGFEIPGKRTEEVRKIYEEPTTPESKQLLRQYNIRFIFLGDKEREAYTALNESGVEALGQVVFQSGKTKIIERPEWWSR